MLCKKSYNVYHKGEKLLMGLWGGVYFLSCKVTRETNMTITLYYDNQLLCLVPISKLIAILTSVCVFQVELYQHDSFLL